MKTVKACRGSGCCPTVELDGHHLVIKDDHGGSIKLTITEYVETNRAVHKLLNSLTTEADPTAKAQLRELFGTNVL